ncbi:tripartite tricarboxylate transporter TctB family protein [Aurantimonas sp. A2-1-M11]|uniref:tripartite tricarboxylate transporter TctB family protein n=1 Tax=Aurantimonas sp. A2-1-M11 TaxID=3113712 RepID=UPI002F92F2A5
MDPNRSLKDARADFWAGLVILGSATAMLAGSLSYPLQGTYAGVRNAWYVSPALFPLIIATGLIVLSLMLLARARRNGGTEAAMASIRHLRPGRMSERSATFWLTAALLVGYVYGLVPRVDFVAATALFLLAFTTLFHLTASAASRLILALFFIVVLAIGGAASLGYETGIRTSGALIVDAAIWLAVFGASAMLLVVDRTPEDVARHARQCVVLSLLAPLILGIVFKYGLLVPLPHEGLTIVGTDHVRALLRSTF